ncbi:MAG: DUF1491 family protein [Pseudomonadota bacterium]
MARLTAGLWIDAYRARLSAEGIPAFITARGDATAGAVIVKLTTLDGNATAYQRVAAFDGGRRWDVLAEGRDSDVDQTIAGARRMDPDLWVVEVEDRDGRHLLGTGGLD